MSDPRTAGSRSRRSGATEAKPTATDKPQAAVRSLSSITEETKREVIELARDGVGCNEIARRIGISASTVSQYAAGAGITFDRRQTRQATVARNADNQVRRVRAASGLLDDLEKIRAEMFGLSILSPRDLRDFANAVASIARAHVEMSKLDSDKMIGEVDLDRDGSAVDAFLKYMSHATDELDGHVVDEVPVEDQPMYEYAKREVRRERGE